MFSIAKTVCATSLYKFQIHWYLDLHVYHFNGMMWDILFFYMSYFSFGSIMARLYDSPYKVQALVLIILALVRGRDGVCFVSCFLANCPQLLETNFNQVVRGILNGHAEQSDGEEASWAAHIEHRHTGQSGMHPIRALLIQDIRDQLLDVAGYWGTFLADLCPAYQLTVQDVMSMAKGIAGNLYLRGPPTAVRARDYTVQHVVKLLALALPALYGCRPLVYCADLHSFLKVKQAGKELGIFADRIGLGHHRAFSVFVHGLSVPSWLDADGSGIGWATAWVHICEVKQALRVYTVAGSVHFAQMM